MNENSGKRSSVSGIPISEYQKRRTAVLSEIGQEGIAILFAAPVRTRSRDVEYPYRASSDFLYLSGFGEADAVLVFVPGREAGETILFCQDKDPKKEQWEGLRCGPNAGVERYGVDQSISIAELAEQMPSLLEGRKKLYYDFEASSMGKALDHDAQVFAWLGKVRARARTGAIAPQSFHSLMTIVHEMRLRKSDAELALMQKAADISAQAHRQAMIRAGACYSSIENSVGQKVTQDESAPELLYEYHLAATLHYIFEDSGATGWAYPSIVGGGENACILHYIENSKPLYKGDLVLIDAGAEYQFYAADITRTFPVSGKFSDEQKALYKLVLSAQLAAIAEVRPGASWNLPHEAAVKVLVEGLITLGLLQGDIDQLIEEKSYQKFYMHNTGHWLGMDVHDVGVYKTDCVGENGQVKKEWRLLEPGMVLTVEPGLYINKSDDSVDAKWRGIGIRIEDDVVVTESGSHVLTAGVPKSVEDIEALMNLYLS